MSQPPVAAHVFWVVIPAYNEGATVRDVAARARRYCTNVIVVDDGSTDETAETLTGLDITLLRNEQNRGKADSLWRGFQQALVGGAAAVITLDADGQHAPEEIPSFITAALHDPEAFLIGARRVEQRKACSTRYVANRVADFWISWAAGRPIEDSQSGFRLYPARFLRNMAVKHGLNQSFVFESEVLIEAGRGGVQCLHIPVNFTPRTGPRASHFRPVLDIARIARMVAWKILQRGLYLRGLLASIRSSPANLVETPSTDVVQQAHQRTLMRRLS
jgi:glycosyltransferase involved in cell wall biosynthesis